MERIKVYHPETDEMFEVPMQKGTELVLEHGWRQQPLASNEPAPVVAPTPVHVEFEFEEHGMPSTEDDED